MTSHNVKSSLLVALLAVLVSACSSTSTEPQASTDTGGVATGAVSGDNLSGSAYDAGGIDTVFYFDFDQATLRAEARAALTLHAERLRARPVSIRLEGHADERGTREYNMALGERRANAVREFLAVQGVDGSLVEVISYGEESPAVMESNEGSWALNRRVELK